MGKVAGGGGRTGFRSLNAGGTAAGEVVREMGFAPNIGQRERQRAATAQALRDGANAIQRTTDTARTGGAAQGVARPTRVQVRVTGAGNVRPTTVGVHTFLVNGRQRAYSRSTYREARRRAIQDAAREGQARISYVGNNG